MTYQKGDLMLLVEESIKNEFDKWIASTQFDVIFEVREVDCEYDEDSKENLYTYRFNAIGAEDLVADLMLSKTKELREAKGP